MPLYEYECQQCHRHTEKRQKFSDPEITECPHCGGKLQRVISAPNFAFAGGGWYKDLYSSTKPKGGDSSAPSGDAKSGDSKVAESKPSTSTESAPAPASAPASAPAASSSTDKK